MGYGFTGSGERAVAPLCVIYAQEDSLILCVSGVPGAGLKTMNTTLLFDK